jgi:hypothetical protein
MYNKLAENNVEINNVNICDDNGNTKLYKKITYLLDAPKKSGEISSIENIYKCNLCEYSTNKKSNYDKHMIGKKHQKKVLSIYVCDICEYSSNKKSHFDRHLLSFKHLEKIEESLKIVFTCSICNYTTNKKNNYDKHMLTNKHLIKFSELSKNDTEINSNSVSNTNNQNITNEVFLSVMNEIKVLMVEIANKPSSTNNITNNKVSNQQFNMNVFLNETCKDAMNMSEFIENLQVSMEDMEKTGELGFAKGMSRIIMNNLNAIDVCKRPIHCSDVKRETLYVKNNGVWEKETEERKRTKEVIYKISSLNVKQLLKWRDLPRNKGYEKSDHKKNDEFTKLVMEVNKLREEEIDKVITNISKHVAIDKEKEKVKMSGYLN